MDNTLVLGQYDMANLFIQFLDKNNNVVYNINDSVALNFLDPSDNLVSIYLVGDKDTFQTIAYKFYGTTRLWWLIARLNNVEDAFIRPKSGSYLKILNPSLITTIASQLAETQLNNAEIASSISE